MYIYTHMYKHTRLIQLMRNFFASQIYFAAPTIVYVSSYIYQALPQLTAQKHN
jgi:hypothetical protein